MSQTPEPEPAPITPPGETTLTPEYVEAHAEIPAEPPSGGDFYAAFSLPEDPGKVVVVMGDVAGHGPEQTLQAEHMQTLLADCLTVGLTPAETLSAVNAMIEPDPHFEGFGTVFVGTLEEGTGRLTYASGGHEPALIADPNREATVQELVGTGPPVGAFPPEMARFAQHEATVPTDGTLLLYTDGVSDAYPPGKRHAWLGLDRLKSLFARLASLRPRSLVARLLRRVASYCRGRFHDDVAVMAIRRLKQSRHSRRK